MRLTKTFSYRACYGKTINLTDYSSRMLHVYLHNQERTSTPESLTITTTTWVLVRTPTHSDTSQSFYLSWLDTFIWKILDWNKSRRWNKGVYQNEFKQGALVNFEELLVPNRNVICPFLLVLVILRRRRVIFVMSAPLNNLMGKHERFEPRWHFAAASACQICTECNSTAFQTGADIYKYKNTLTCCSLPSSTGFFESLRQLYWNMFFKPGSPCSLLFI